MASFKANLGVVLTGVWVCSRSLPAAPLIKKGGLLAKAYLSREVRFMEGSFQGMSMGGGWGSPVSESLRVGCQPPWHRDLSRLHTHVLGVRTS